MYTLKCMQHCQESKTLSPNCCKMCKWPLVVQMQSVMCNKRSLGTKGSVFSHEKFGCSNNLPSVSPALLMFWQEIAWRQKTKFAGVFWDFYWMDFDETGLVLKEMFSKFIWYQVYHCTTNISPLKTPILIGRHCRDHVRSIK